MALALHAAGQRPSASRGFLSPVHLLPCWVPITSVTNRDANPPLASGLQWLKVLFQSWVRAVGKLAATFGPCRWPGSPSVICVSVQVRIRVCVYVNGEILRVWYVGRSELEWSMHSGWSIPGGEPSETRTWQGPPHIREHSNCSSEPMGHSILSCILLMGKNGYFQVEKRPTFRFTVQRVAIDGIHG